MFLFFLGRRNYALSGQASKSSEYGDYYASRANDGQIYAIGHYIAHTLTIADEWLKIDLGAYIYLALMAMYNRDGDCSGNPCGKC